MPRGLVVLFALLEALLVVGLGVVVPFVFGLLGWASLSGLSATPLGVWQLAVQAWALGHGIPLTVTLGDESTVLTDTLATFSLTLAPFAFAIVTLLLGRRAGRRLAGADDATLVVGLLVFFVTALSVLALMSGQNDSVSFDVATGTARVLTPFVVGLVAGWKPWDDLAPGRTRVRIPEQWRDVIETAVRIASATLAGLVAIAALTIAVRVVLGFATEIALYESLHTGILGGLVITVAQLSLVPVAVVWTIAWFVGPGFVLGAGTIVSPFATTIGAVPAVPMLGAVPDAGTVGWWVTLVPGAIALAVAVRFSRDLRTRDRIFNPGDTFDLTRVAVTSAGAALASALAMLVIGSYASGAAGPGRFAQVGVDAVAVAGILAGGVFVGSAIGLFAGKLARDVSA